MISNPVTKRGPGREKYALALTAYTLPFCTALTCFHRSGNVVRGIPALIFLSCARRA